MKIPVVELLPLKVYLFRSQELVFKSKIWLKSRKSPNSRSSSRLKDLEFGLFGVFSRISDLNTNSCVQIQT